MNSETNKSSNSARAGRPAAKRSKRPSKVNLAQAPAGEADHRIGRSLQILVDMLRRRARNAGPKVRTELEDVARRIRVVGILHEHLSMSGGPGEVALDAYLHSIGRDLRAAFGESAQTLLINVDGGVVSAEVARLVGLIVHELVLDALKGAFGDGAGIVQIACGENRDGGLTLEASDEGTSRTDEVGSSEHAMDTALVSALVSRLGGRMSVKNDHSGRRCTIVIPRNG